MPKTLVSAPYACGVSEPERMLLPGVYQPLLIASETPGAKVDQGDVRRGRRECGRAIVGNGPPANMRARQGLLAPRSIHPEHPQTPVRLLRRDYRNTPVCPSE